MAKAPYFGSLASSANPLVNAHAPARSRDRPRAFAPAKGAARVRSSRPPQHRARSTPMSPPTLSADKASALEEAQAAKRPPSTRRACPKALRLSSRGFTEVARMASGSPRQAFPSPVAAHRPLLCRGFVRRASIANRRTTCSVCILRKPSGSREVPLVPPLRVGDRSRQRVRRHARQVRLKRSARHAQGFDAFPIALRQVLIAGMGDYVHRPGDEVGIALLVQYEPKEVIFLEVERRILRGGVV